MSNIIRRNKYKVYLYVVGVLFIPALNMSTHPISAKSPVQEINDNPFEETFNALDSLSVMVDRGYLTNRHVNGK